MVKLYNLLTGRDLKTEKTVRIAFRTDIASFYINISRGNGIAGFRIGNNPPDFTFIARPKRYDAK